jgi:hypothetical protein
VSTGILNVFNKSRSCRKRNPFNLFNLYIKKVKQNLLNENHTPGLPTDNPEMEILLSPV